MPCTPLHLYTVSVDPGLSRRLEIKLILTNALCKHKQAHTALNVVLISLAQAKNIGDKMHTEDCKPQIQSQKRPTWHEKKSFIGKS